ncbi:adenine phosphoribosyltransferase [Altererythrobacter xixiisoli]|uniref:Adenine phosphoribosyltransferase n=1 Tax=Croceibacterium xixiisoli TaxID=1476466 RepID=A0A6I4TV56_9SPHN|nr:adenine phosphoribosyltransferase [Croceibacterium xixiisoli]MXP00096.1 adenine phosphoribosyltransferase [Croceibacterium xixiisoli]
MTPAELVSVIRTIPDFPKPGIVFRDITTLIANGPALSATIAHLAALAGRIGVETIAAVEARGFIIGAALANQLCCGLIPLRKPGKLPVPTVGVDYSLEYGTARLELDPGMMRPGQRVLLVDDLIATGGTALAGLELLRGTGASVDHALFVVDLPDLGGADALRHAGVEVASLMSFPGH